MTAAKSVAPMRGRSAGSNGLLVARSFTVGLARLVFVSLSTAYAAPVSISEHYHDEAPEEDGASLWVLYVASLALVLLGGAFAGLTIALMGQDGIYLQVVAGDHHEPQQKNAKRVFDLLQKGKHWVLVTLLLSNVIVNETLPVVLDRCLGGGVAAVVGSTFLIVIFGEIIPQSICVRYGLQIGGVMSKPILMLMYMMAPIAWPTAKLLDKLLGEDHGTVYKKSGLKTLVTLHKNLGEVSERLNQDEVTIISAVLDLKEKPVANVMTPMEDVFVMAEDTVLDEKTMDMILSAGYSRIPIHESGNPTNFVGMLLVKILITYDPEDGMLVRDFPLATLPETRPETSCLDIVNFFQEGKSHMVLVSEFPGEDHGALGVVTLEDVIEELIGEEIIDESDVYIDVHKAIRRLAPAPKARVQRRPSQDPIGKASDDSTVVADQDCASDGHEIQHKRVGSIGGAANDTSTPLLGSSPKTTTFMMRRSSAGVGGQTVKTMIPVRANFEEMRQHLKHLGPSNPATNPKNTRSTTVKVKPGIVTERHPPPPRSASVAEALMDERILEEGHESETTSLLRPGITGKDGIQELSQDYGSVNVSALNLEAAEQSSRATPTPSKTSPVEQAPDTLAHRSSASDDSVRSLRPEGALIPKRSSVRSGSITENVIESRGVRKVVLETTSSNDEDEVVVITSCPDQPKAASRSTLNFFGPAVAEPVSEGEEEDDGNDLPSSRDGAGDSGPSGENESKSKAGGSSGSAGGSSSNKKKNRRKKRKGGKS
ncbi:hypothetical protein QBC46DRAFT_371272 [Diplogelasinospora grovesii]|uniref:Uncharacterized protein n=1 Tax=Diplogelasinospora grovesii TaxID=303347 RepID=A0AAN6SA51_9PEZI|nr:hypothetical protein QBC46DRAFT_371272 [Diplogelasinospora grovesii]